MYEDEKPLTLESYGVMGLGLLLISTSFNKLWKISRLAIFGRRTDEPDASSMHPSS
jgi:hypothetical protein